MFRPPAMNTAAIRCDGQCPKRARRGALLLGVLWASVGNLSGADVSCAVRDQDARPVHDAVVYALPAGGSKVTTGAGESAAGDKKVPSQGDGTAPAGAKVGAVIDQKDKQFVPYLTVVRTGTTVAFPNSDSVYHHVYSLSPARPFELPLYKGRSPRLVQFDQPGVVKLGCNIHDWMRAYILIVDTPHFARTDADGKTVVAGLPPGDWDLHVWHAQVKEGVDNQVRRVTVGQDGAAGKAEFTLGLEPDVAPARRPLRRLRGY